jgi:hypothetical protein
MILPKEEFVSEKIPISLKDNLFMIAVNTVGLRAKNYG